MKPGNSALSSVKLKLEQKILVSSLIQFLTLPRPTKSESRVEGEHVAHVLASRLGNSDARI